MSEPSREHIEAVGEAVRNEIKRYPTQPKSGTYDAGRYSHLTWGATEHTLAFAVLTSTDPAVLDAMQDALVRAGRLTEDQRTLDDGRAWQVVRANGAIESGSQPATVQHRYVTKWGSSDA